MNCNAGGFNPQFIPRLEGIMSLFSRVVTAASLWVHLLAINLFSARTILREGASLNISQDLNVLANLPA